MINKASGDGCGVHGILLPTQVVALMADIVNERGISDADILKDTGLQVSELRKRSTLIRYEQVLKMIENAISLYPEPGLGLLVGSRENITSWGLLGFVMMSAPDLKTSLEIGTKYLAAGPALVDIRCYPAGNDYCIEAYTPMPLGSLLPFVVEEIFSSLYVTFPVILGKPFMAKEIHLSYSEPSYSDKYDKTFNCPVYFDSPGNYFIVDSSFLSSPLVTANSVSAELCISLCEESLIKNQYDIDIEYNIRRILVRTPNTFPSMEQVADELGMSIRSLRRYLVEKETSYQKILDDVRMEIAIQLLENSKVSLADIGERVGFSEYNNFRKAFKRWTGTSPTAFREGKT